MTSLLDFDMPWVSPYACLDLFRNPFGELSRSERAELASIELQDCLRSIGTGRSMLQILGPCGYGKTTHLLAMERALVDAPYVYFPEDGHQPVLPRARPLLVDEAQRMSWRRKRELLRSSGPLILGTHADFSKPFSRAGFEVTTIDLTEPVTTVRLQQILNRRIVASRLPPTERPLDNRPLDDSSLNNRPLVEPSRLDEVHRLSLSLVQVQALQEKFGNNVRGMEDHLYEIIQQMVASQN